MQHGVLVHQFCRPIWARWLETAQLAGRLELSDPVAARMVQWIPPRWDWVDPLKDANAEIAQIEAGLKSRTQAIAERGYDAEQVDREIAAERARERALGAAGERAVEIAPVGQVFTQAGSSPTATRSEHKVHL